MAYGERPIRPSITSGSVDLKDLGNSFFFDPSGRRASSILYASTSTTVPIAILQSTISAECRMPLHCITTFTKYIIIDVFSNLFSPVFHLKLDDDATQSLPTATSTTGPVHLVVCSQVGRS